MLLSKFKMSAVVRVFGLGAALLLGPAVTDSAIPVQTKPLRGIVYAADGTAAGGAIVWAAKHSHGPLERRETTCDAKGRYTLELDPGAWFIWARRGTQGGEGPAAHQTVKVVAGQTPGEVAIRLEERGTFRGRLLEAETGKPIVGGQLFVDAGLVLKTDGVGRFEVGGLSRSHHEAFVVAAGRRRMRVLFDTTARADTELDVPVPRAGKIVGRVTDMSGKAIAGACVGRYTSGSYFSINGLWVACGAQGRFEYDDAVEPDQPTRLSAEAPGYVGQSYDGVRAPPGKPLELHFRLRPKPDDRPRTGAPAADRRRTVTGTVSSPDGKPDAGVVVRWGYQPYVGAMETRTDEAGRFRLIVPEQANMLAVLPRDFLPEFPPVPAKGDRQVQVRLRTGHTARGRVVDDAGKPIANVMAIAVVASPDPRICNSLWLAESSVHTDAEGKFELKGVPEAATFDFLKSGMSDLRNQRLQLDGAENRVTLAYDGAVKGRVLDRNGAAIRNFRVLVNFPRERRNGDAQDGFFAGYCGIGVRFTAADGSFVLTGVGAGSVYRITALAEGHGEATLDRVTAVPVNRLDATKAVTLRAGPAVDFRVRALTSAGQPIAGARVTLVNGAPALDRSFAWGYNDASWENMVRSRTGTDGWANFPELSYGGATVLVQAPGYARYKAGWRNGKSELTAALAREAVISGEVRDAGGKAVPAFFVALRSEGDQISESVDAAAMGRFRIAQLPAGTWTVTIGSPDGGATLHEEGITLRAGERRELKIADK